MVCWASTGEKRNYTERNACRAICSRKQRRIGCSGLPADTLETMPMTKNMEVFLYLYREEILSETFINQPNDRNECFTFR